MLSWQPSISCISTCNFRFAGLFPVSTVFVVLNLCPACPCEYMERRELGDVPPGKDCYNNWNEPVLKEQIDYLTLVDT